MIAHLALFSPRADLSPSEQSAIIDALKAAAAAIPGIVRFRVGRRVRLGLPGYEQAARQPYEYIALIEFEDAGALQAYLTHPAHAPLGAHFTESASTAAAFDFELVDVEDASSLLR